MRVPGASGESSNDKDVCVCVVFTSLQPIVDVHMMDDALTAGVRQGCIAMTLRTNK